MKPVVDVVAGVIRRADGKILLSLRLDNVDQGGLWEFPGGKREASESRIEALRRELKEELDITIQGAIPLLRLSHEYPTKIVDLDVWEVLQWEGSELGREGQRIEWVKVADLQEYDFPAANKNVVGAAQLPRVLVTMPRSTSDRRSACLQLERCLALGAGRVSMMPVAFHQNSDNTLRTEMESITRRFDVKIVEVIAAKELVEHNTDLARLQSRPQAVVKLDRDVLVGALCSSISDVECANRRSVDVVLIGPISAFKNHSAAIPLGWQEVEFLLNKTKIPTFVFGELSPRHLARAITVGCQGIVLDETYWCDDIYHTIDSLAEFYLASEIRTG